MNVFMVIRHLPESIQAIILTFLRRADIAYGSTPPTLLNTVDVLKQANVDSCSPEHVWKDKVYADFGSYLHSFTLPFPSWREYYIYLLKMFRYPTRVLKLTQYRSLLFSLITAENERTSPCDINVGPALTGDIIISSGLVTYVEIFTASRFNYIGDGMMGQTILAISQMSPRVLDHVNIFADKCWYMYIYPVNLGVTFTIDHIHHHDDHIFIILEYYGIRYAFLFKFRVIYEHFRSIHDFKLHLIRKNMTIEQFIQTLNLNKLNSELWVEIDGLERSDLTYASIRHYINNEYSVHPSLIMYVYLDSYCKF